MMPWVLTLALLSAAAGFNLFGLNYNSETTPPKGVFHLTQQQLQTNTTVKLSGEWAFVWNEFLTDFDSLKVRQSIGVPGSWSRYTHTLFLEKEVGYCTYGLRVVLPEAGQKWSLHLPPIHSAYKLFINGKVYAEVGKISPSSAMIPGVNTGVIDFTTQGNEAIIIIQVSNYHFSSGGIWTPISIGKPNAIRKERELSLLVSSFLIGSLLIMGIYHLALYFIRRKDKSPLYFSFICFSIALRESFGGEAIFYTAWPSVNYEFSTKLLYAVFPIALIAFLLYFENLFPTYQRWMKRITIGASSAFLLMILVTDNTVYGKYLLFISLMFFVQSIYWLILIISNVAKTFRDNVLVLAGVVVLLLAFINDISFEAGVINSYFMLPFGFFFFVLCQSILLSIRFSRAFHQSELLSVELMKSNLAYQEMSLKQQQAEERKELEEMKNHFFSNITHEFRTPLSLIISPVEKLLHGNWDKKLLEKSFATIHRSAIQLLQLINQLLDLSKLEARKMEVTRFRGNPQRFLEDIVFSFNFSAAEKDIALSFASPQLPTEAIFDAEKLEKVFFNLLSNALKFTPTGGSVSVQASHKDEVLVITVRDTGLGIPPGKLPHIFERFYQIDNSLTRSFTGTGIGLALVKELVDLIGGTITVESQPSEGTTFHVQFPLSLPVHEVDDDLPAPILSLAPAPRYIPHNDLAKEDLIDGALILLVEDNQELLDYIYSDLSQKYRVITAANGKEAWQICQQELPDVVISDVMMPEMNGFDLCGKIKETEVTNHIGVILLTAKGSMENKVLGLSLGANDYLPKPFNQQELELRISNFLSFKQNLKLSYSRELSGLTKSGEKQNKENDNPFLLKLYATIEQSIDNPELSVNDVATALAVSARTLNRKLTSMIGLSANEVIRNYRLRKAIHLLRSGSNVSETAYRVGFESPSYFGQCFKEVYKTTPSEFLAS